jgi:hypothetical protein
MPAIPAFEFCVTVLLLITSRAGEICPEVLVKDARIAWLVAVAELVIWLPLMVAWRSDAGLALPGV